MGTLRSVFPQARRADLNSEHATFLSHGRALDTTAMREILGFSPQYTTPETFDAFARRLRPGPINAQRVVRRRGVRRSPDRPGGATWPTLTSYRSEVGARPAAARPRHHRRQRERWPRSRRTKPAKKAAKPVKKAAKPPGTDRGRCAADSGRRCKQPAAKKPRSPRRSYARRRPPRRPSATTEPR